MGVVSIGVVPMGVLIAGVNVMGALWMPCQEHPGP